MTTFILVLLLALALVTGAWLKLGPGPDERRQGRLRTRAIDAGYRVRLVGREEREQHDLPVACWYVATDGPRPERAERWWVRRNAGWLDVAAGEILPVPLRVPAGVVAVHCSPDEVAVAWNEQDESEVEAVMALLATLRGQGRVSST